MATTKICAAAFALLVSIALFVDAAKSQSIVDEWSAVEVPPPPELHRVTITPETTVLLIMGFVDGSCNMERRPRCVATIPAVKTLLEGARARRFGDVQRPNQRSDRRRDRGRACKASGRGTYSAERTEQVLTL